MTAEAHSAATAFVHDRRHRPTDGALVRRQVRGPNVDAAHTAAMALKHELAGAGVQLIATSWRPTRTGVTIELLFTDVRRREEH